MESHILRGRTALSTDDRINPETILKLLK